MNITVMDIFWLMLASATITGLLIILSAAVTGYITFRAKREQHETLFPSKPAKRKGPIVMDEFASDVLQDSDEGLPDVIKRMNAKMGAELAMSGLKNKGGK